MLCGLASLPCTAQNVKQLLTATGGIAISGPNGGPFTASYGNVNGLGIGTPTGSTPLSVSGGEFYYTPYTMVVSGAGGGNPALVKAWVSTPFTNSSTVLQLFSCPYPNACNTYPGTYTAMPVSQATEVTVLPSQGVNGNYNAYLGLFVGDVNGITLTSPDTVQVTFDIYNGSNNTLKHSIVLNLTVTAQTAVEMQLATDSADSGQTINFNSNTVNPNYTTSFGTVNGLGIGPGAGLTVVSGAVANGSLYATPYLIEPQYSGFGTTSSTSVTAYVSTNFAQPTILKLYDSGTANSGYSLLSTLSGSPTSLAGSYTNGGSVRRYLGLYVANANGAGITGSETATITYTILVH